MSKPSEYISSLPTEAFYKLAYAAPVFFVLERGNIAARLIQHYVRPLLAFSKELSVYADNIGVGVCTVAKRGRNAVDSDLSHFYKLLAFAARGKPGRRYELLKALLHFASPSI